MKKLLPIAALIAILMAASCRSPITMYDPEYDDRVTEKVYYERHPEEKYGSADVTIVIQ